MKTGKPEMVVSSSDFFQSLGSVGWSSSNEQEQYKAYSRLAVMPNMGNPECRANSCNFIGRSLETFLSLADRRVRASSFPVKPFLHDDSEVVFY